MVIAIAVVIENVFLSRRRTAEFSTSRFCIQTPASFTHLVAKKPDLAPVYPVCPESVQH
jgi:hypothetical protein